MAPITLNPQMRADRPVIQSYGNGGFRIAGAVHRGSCLVFIDGARSWSPRVPADVTHETLADVAAHASGVRILIIGCGRHFVKPPTGLAEALRGQGIVLEWMDTGAACRTFNVLLGEERPVAAALLAVD